MKKLMILAFAAFVALVAAGCKASDYHIPVMPNEPTEVLQPSFTRTMPDHLIIIGDSIMAGSTTQDGYSRNLYSETAAHKMAASHNIRVSNLSRSGQSFLGAVVTQDISGAINFLTEKKSDIWIQLGANDYGWGFSSPNEYRSRYMQLLESIEYRSDYNRIYCAVPLRASFDFEIRTNPHGYAYETYRQVVRDVAAQGLCRLVETDLWFNQGEVERGSVHLPDGLHLSGAGHNRYAFYMTLNLMLED